MIDSSYTACDHAFRDNDAYARGKYELTLRWLARDVPAPATLVNVGCGAGLFNAMAATAGYRVRAYEPDPDAFAEASRRAPRGVEVSQLGLAEIPVQEADVVVLHDVLEHIADEQAALEHLAALVGPSGRLVLSVPALPSLFGFHDEQLGHHRRYTRSSLRAAVGRSFEIDRLRYYGMTFIPITAWYSRARRVAYPTGSAGLGVSMLGRAFDLACRAESRLPTPIGTSLVLSARRSQPTGGDGLSTST